VQKSRGGRADKSGLVDGYEGHIPNNVEAGPEIGQGRCVGVAENFVGLPMTLDPSSLKKLAVMSDQRAIFK
jgi:hypothetical protein